MKPWRRRNGFDRAPLDFCIAAALFLAGFFICMAHLKQVGLDEFYQRSQSVTVTVPGAGLLTHDHGFLLKLMFAVAVVASTLPIVRDLSVPGRRIGRASLMAAVPFAIMVMLALRELGSAPAGTWHDHVGQADIAND